MAPIESSSPIKSIQLLPPHGPCNAIQFNDDDDGGGGMEMEEWNHGSYALKLWFEAIGIA